MKISDNTPMPAEAISILRITKRKLRTTVKLLSVQYLFKERRQVPCATNTRGEDILYHQTLNQN